jgi:hypothetical protein
MKFLSFSVLALSLVSHIVAEPISLSKNAIIERGDSPIETIASTLLCVVEDVEADLKSIGTRGQYQSHE